MPLCQWPGDAQWCGGPGARAWAVLVRPNWTGPSLVGPGAPPSHPRLARTPKESRLIEGPGRGTILANNRRQASIISTGDFQTTDHISGWVPEREHTAPKWEVRASRYMFDSRLDMLWTCSECATSAQGERPTGSGKASQPSATTSKGPGDPLGRML
jgi:hypothetical protein